MKKIALFTLASTLVSVSTLYAMPKELTVGLTLTSITPVKTNNSSICAADLTLLKKFENKMDDVKITVDGELLNYSGKVRGEPLTLSADYDKIKVVRQSFIDSNGTARYYVAQNVNYTMEDKKFSSIRLNELSVPKNNKLTTKSKLVLTDDTNNCSFDMTAIGDERAAKAGYDLVTGR